MNKGGIDLPYVVSGDLYRLMKEWEEGGGGNIPKPLFFDELRNDFRKFMQKLFPHRLVFLHEELLHRGINKIAGGFSIPIIPLTPVYYHGRYVIDVTRRLDPNNLHSWGLGPRAGMPSLPQQMIALYQRLRKLKCKSVAVLDDTVYKAEQAFHISDMLEALDIKVEAVIAGVAIGHGISVLKSRNPPIEVKAAYSFDEVTDALSERDVYIGAPMSGHNLLNLEETIPYAFPWGHPGVYANIPPKAWMTYSRFSIVQSIKLWRAVEKATGMPITCERLPRKVKGFPAQQRVVQVLKEVLALFPLLRD